MSSDPRLDAALTILRDAGHQIGDTYFAPDDGGTLKIWIGVFLALLGVSSKWLRKKSKLRTKRAALLSTILCNTTPSIWIRPILAMRIGIVICKAVPVSPCKA
jgi:hypothetical protein